VRRVRRALAFCVILLALGFAGCGEDADSLRDRADRLERQAREQVDRLKDERDRLLKRFEQILADLERAIPEARETSPRVQSGGRTGETEIGRFMTDILESVDAYWTETLRANDLPEPRVGFFPVPPGEVVDTACGPAGDTAAFYCPSDDTIYVSQAFAAALWDGVLEGLPGTGRAAGDFGVAYVLAHEYGHNLQQEFGVFTRPSPTAEPFELQADCFAGAWGNSVYRQGLLQPGDVEEAINTALAVGDFDVSNAQHHGTPEERREAWLLGFEGGDPGACERYIAG
jgi:predicted metalloprotease